jgi:hypothetical protein
MKCTTEEAVIIENAVTFSEKSLKNAAFGKNQLNIAGKAITMNLI